MDMKTEKSLELRRDVRKFAEENPEIAAQMVKTGCGKEMTRDERTYIQGRHRPSQAD